MKEIEGMKIIHNPAILTNELFRVVRFTGWFISAHHCVHLSHTSFCHYIMSHALHNYHLKINALIIILITT